MKVIALLLLFVFCSVQMVVGQTDDWVDDAFLLKSSESSFDQSLIDLIVSDYSCTNYHVISNRIVRFHLPEGSDEENIVFGLSESLPPGIFSAFLEEIWRSNESVDSTKVHDYIDPVQHIQPYSDNTYSTDPLYWQQWYLNSENSNIWEVWQTPGADYSEVVIYILDTGLDIGHCEFETAYNTGQIEFVQYTQGFENNWTPENSDETGHGTKVTGIISAAHNGTGMMGMAPDVKIIVGDVTYDAGGDSGPGSTTPGIILGAFAEIALYANDNPNKKIIVLTVRDYVFPQTHRLFPDVVSVFNSLSLNHNVLIVSAVGNYVQCSNGSAPLYGGRVYGYSSMPAIFSAKEFAPGIDDIVVAVGGISYWNDPLHNDLRIKPYESGSWHGFVSGTSNADTCSLVVDVAAPTGGATRKEGECEFKEYLGILTTTLSNEQGDPDCYEYCVGTSYAAPQIAAIAALTWAYSPGLTAEEIKYLLRSNTEAYQLQGNLFLPISAPWGPNRYRGLKENYEELCPQEFTPFNPPVFWPDGTQKGSKGGFLFDSLCSPVFGSGIVDGAATILASNGHNIYRFFGGVISEDITIEDADMIRVYGDLIVPAGVTFTVKSRPESGNVRWSIMGADLNNLGVDPNKVEIIVEPGGSLIVEGDATWFTTYRFDDSWSGLTIMDGAVFGDPSFQTSLYIEGAENGLVVNSNYTHVSSLTIESYGDGLFVGGDFACSRVSVQSAGSGIVIAHGGYLSVTGDVSLANEEGTVLASGVEFNGDSGLSSGSLTVTNFFQGIHLTPDCNATISGPVFLENISIFGCTLDDLSTFNLDGSLAISAPGGDNCLIGLYLRNGCSYTASSTELDSCDYGLFVIPHTPVLVSGGIVTTNCEIGLSLASNSLIFTNGDVVFNGPGAGYGVKISDGVIISGNPITCTDFDYGLRAYGCTGPFLQSEISISDSNIHGMYLSVCSNISMLGPLLIETSNQSGIYLDRTTDVIIRNALLTDNAVAGISVTAGSSGIIRESTMDGNKVGILVDEFSTFDAGNIQSGFGVGDNFFIGQNGTLFKYFVCNYNQGHTMNAEGNDWDEGFGPSCPPYYTRFLGPLNTTCE